MSKCNCEMKYIGIYKDLECLAHYGKIVKQRQCIHCGLNEFKEVKKDAA